jgi:hypothetical protein
MISFPMRKEFQWKIAEEQTKTIVSLEEQPTIIKNTHYYNFSH